jgi:histidinol-phosphate aminotransferase
VAAAVAGLASLRHVEQIYAVVNKLKTERERLFAALKEIPYLRPFPSQSNFILCDVIGHEGKTIKLALERKGILVRHYSKPRLENCIRISVGRPEQTDRLLAALREIA